MPKWKKILSFAYNFFRNINLVDLAPGIIELELNQESLSLEKFSLHFSPTQSPSRNLSNLFWAEIDFEEISRVLGAPINALEIGCGTGRYSQYFRHHRYTYTGIDILKSDLWSSYETKTVEFFQDSYVNTEKYLEGKNFIFTQSALEHFEYDLHLIKKLDKKLSERNSPSIVVHVVPPSSALFSYLWHGLRQYPVRAINKILKKSFSENYVITLGGVKTNKVHRKFITYPSLLKKLDLRISLPDSYLSNLMIAVKKDIRRVRVRNATSIVIIQVYNASCKLDCGKLFKG